MTTTFEIPEARNTTVYRCANALQGDNTEHNKPDTELFLADFQFKGRVYQGFYCEACLHACGQHTDLQNTLSFWMLARNAQISPPAYTCDGADGYGPEAAYEVHPRGQDEFHQPDELVYMVFVEEECEMEHRGFYCRGCREAAGYENPKAPTLASEIERRKEA